MAHTFSSVEEARQALVKSSEQLSLVPHLLSRAADRDASVTPSELTGGETLVVDIVGELRRIAEALEDVGPDS